MIATTSFTATQAAPAVSCQGCGSALPVDPTAPYAWCASCHAWRPVPDELRRQAFQQQEALRAVYAAGLEARAEADKYRNQMRAVRRGALGGYAVLAFLVFMALVTIVPIAAFWLISLVQTIVDELEPWAAALALSALVVTIVVFALAALGAIWGLYRRFFGRRKRHLEHAEWFGEAGDGVAAAVCGVCGAPVAFHVGQQSTTCAYCASVVVAAPVHARRLLAIALSEVQLGRLEAARVERDKLRTELGAARSKAVLQAYRYAGVMALLAVPVVAAVYAWRMLTPSIEERLAALSKQLKGKYGSGLEPPFEWLDAYWIGDTPAAFREISAFQSRYSIESVFYGRPFLLTTTTNWSDRVAKRSLLLVARPRSRDGATENASAIEQLRALGWTVHSDYAGIALEATNLREADFSAEKITTLARLVYEVAEEGR